MGSEMCIRDSFLWRHVLGLLDRSKQRTLVGGNDLVGRLDLCCGCLLYTSDAADERSSVDLGGRRIIKKKKISEQMGLAV